MADDAINNTVRALMVQISSMITGCNVLNRLYGILPLDQINDIRRLYHRGLDTKATFKMLDCLLQCRTVGKWQAFIEALSEEEYPYIVSLLDGHTDNSEGYVKRIMHIFAPFLELYVDPRCLVDSLRAGDVINDSDVQEILAKQSEQGAVSATAVLLQRVRGRLAPAEWYLKFLKVLYKKGYQTIVKEMEPDFSLDCEVMKCPQNPESGKGDNEGKECHTDEIEKRIEVNITKLKCELANKIEMGCILPLVSCDLFQDESTVSRVISAIDISNSEGVKVMLCEIHNASITGKWRIFVQCLQKADYPDLSNRLLSPTPEVSTNTADQIISIFNCIIAGKMNLTDLLSHMVAEDIINYIDNQEIVELYNQFGSTRAAGLLIQRMQCRQPTAVWYPVFMKTLIKCNYTDLAKMIDPDFCEKLTLQENEAATETTRSSTIAYSDSEDLKRFKKQVNEYETSVLQVIERVEQKMMDDFKMFHNFQAECHQGLEDIRRKLLGPVNRSKLLYQRFTDGDMQNIETLRIEVENEMKENVQYRIEYTPKFEICNESGIAGIKLDGICSETSKEKRAEESILKHKRRNSKESVSSASTGFIEVSGSKAYQTQSNSSDESRTQDETSNYASTGSSRTPSPTACTGRSKVSFKESIDDNPSLVLRQNILKNMRVHKRSTSMGDLHNLIIEIKGRRRAISESGKPVSEEEENSMKLDKDKSVSLDEKTWFDKSTFHHSDIGKAYESVTEAKADRKRTVSTSSSICSDTSVCPMSSSYASSGGSLWHVSSAPSSVPHTNNCSLVFHEKFHKHGGVCMFTDICSTTTDDIVVVDHHCSSVLIYDIKIKQFRTLISSSARFKPYKIGWCCDGYVYTMYKSSGCFTKLFVYQETKEFSIGRRARIKGLEYSGMLSFDCDIELSDISASGDKLAAFCYKKHVHFISNGQVTCVLNLRIRDLIEWWPESTAVYVKMGSIFIFDIYSQRLYCFDINTGSVQWKMDFIEEESIEGMAIIRDRLYITQNAKNRLVIIDVESNKTQPGVVSTFSSEELKYPFALGSSREALLVTQYHRNRNRLNRTVKCF